jgi:hypothetical protein
VSPLLPGLGTLLGAFGELGLDAPKPAATHRSPVPLANLDDWLEFAEALLGRQDRARNSLADEHFETLSALEEFEERLESDFYLDMDPVWRLGE